MKRIVLLSLLIFGIFNANCLSALLIEEKNIDKRLDQFIISGETEKGNIVGYSVVSKNGNKGDVNDLYAVGDVLADDDGEFKITFEFPTGSISGIYTLYYGTSKEGIKSLDFDYVNTSSALIALKNATALSDVENIFKPDSEYHDALKYMGFDMTLFDSLSNKNIVCKNLNDNCSFSESEIGDILGFFDKYLGLECVNEKKPGGIEFINPLFEGVAYNDIETLSLKKYLTEKIYNSSYSTISEFETAYKTKNIFYKIDIASVGSFLEIIEKYDADLGITGKTFYSTFKTMSNFEQNSVATSYLNNISNEGIDTTSRFENAFKDAVQYVIDNRSTEGGAGNSVGGTSGGGSSGSLPSVSIPTQQSGSHSYPFTDIDSVKWATNAITNLSSKGIISGMGDGRFEPNQNVTREQAVKIIISSLGIKPISQVSFFDDVKSGEWYSSYIAEAFRRGIISGVDDGTFGIGSEIKRQDLAVIIVKAARIMGLSQYEAQGSTSNFSDNDEISEYAREAVGVLSALGVISGKGNNKFAPMDTCTRAEAAQMVYNAFFKEGE